jgi:hypothetical protein
MKLVPGKPWRLAVRMEGDSVNLLIDDVPATYGMDLPPLEAIGSKVGVTSTGGAEFREFVGWPTSVEIPETLAAKIPPVHLRAEGDVVVRDDFEAPDGTPLDGRVPKWGRHPWKVAQGEWSIERGAAVLKKAPGVIAVDCGHSDYELSAVIELPKNPPAKGDWFPGILARAPSSGPFLQVGGIAARFLWQSGSNEIEVWDRPPGTPENIKKWAAPDGPDKGRLLTELINATKPHAAAPAGPDPRAAPRRPRKPGELLLRRPARGHRQHARLARSVGRPARRRPGRRGREVPGLLGEGLPQPLKNGFTTKTQRSQSSEMRSAFVSFVPLWCDSYLERRWRVASSSPLTGAPSSARRL